MWPESASVSVASLPQASGVCWLLAGRRPAPTPARLRLVTRGRGPLLSANGICEALFLNEFPSRGHQGRGQGQRTLWGTRLNSGLRDKSEAGVTLRSARRVPTAAPGAPCRPCAPADCSPSLNHRGGERLVTRRGRWRLLVREWPSRARAQFPPVSDFLMDGPIDASRILCVASHPVPVAMTAALLCSHSTGERQTMTQAHTALEGQVSGRRGECHSHRRAPPGPVGGAGET